MNKQRREDQLRRRAKAFADRQAERFSVVQELASLQDRLDLKLSYWADDLARRYNDEIGEVDQKKSPDDLD